MKKRGQVTIFIIIGLIIFIAVLGLMYILRSTTSNDLLAEKEIPETAGIKSFVEDCLRRTAKEGMYVLGEQGGYYAVPREQAITFFSFDTPLYLTPSEKHIPTMDLIENQLSVYVEDHLESCLDNFIPFTRQGFAVKAGELNSEITIIPREIIVDLSYPLTFEKGPASTTLETFTAKVDLDFDSFFAEIQKSLAEQQRFRNEIPLGSVMDLAYKNNYHLEIDNLENNIILYTFLFDAGEEEPYLFSYAVEYDWPEELFTIS